MNIRNLFQLRAFLVAAIAGFTAATAGVLSTNALAQTFLPTSGTHLWNVNSNWDTASFPNAVDAFATLPAPTGDLTVDLGQPITVGTLTINKAVSDAFDTVIAGSATNTLTLDGAAPTITNGFSSVGTGLTIVDAPVVLNAAAAVTTITQGNDDRLEFRQSISGPGSLKINRDTNGSGRVVLGAANTYAGSTTFEGVGGTDVLFARLDDPNSTPGGIGATGGTSNLTLTNSAVIGLASGDFLRNNGTGAAQFQFLSPAGNSGWAAYGGDRIVNIGGASASKVWGGLGIGTLAFGASDADGMIDFQNPLQLGGGTVNRTIRVFDGSAPIDARMSNVISGASTGNFIKQGGGVLALSAANTYPPPTPLLTMACFCSNMRAPSPQHRPSISAPAASWDSASPTSPPTSAQVQGRSSSPTGTGASRPTMPTAALPSAAAPNSRGASATSSRTAAHCYLARTALAPTRRSSSPIPSTSTASNAHSRPAMEPPPSMAESPA